MTDHVLTQDGKWYTTTHDELYHAGVKGMKWGVRRYQNKDGSLTAAGKARYNRDIQDNNAKKKENRIVIDGPDPKRWAREDTSRAKRVVDASSDAVRELDKVATKIPTKKQKMDLSKMTDQQLRERINRANLEKQYNDLFAPTEASKLARGKEHIHKTLETAGTVLAIGSSALGIALAIKELKG